MTYPNYVGPSDVRPGDVLDTVGTVASVTLIGQEPVPADADFGQIVAAERWTIAGDLATVTVSGSTIFDAR